MLPAATPLALRPVPVAVTLEIVTFEFPLFFSVTLEAPVAPRFTFPKPRRVGATPVPLKEIAIGEPGALLVSEIEPVTLPADVGANTTLKDEVLPGAIVSGTVKPVVLKPVPDVLA